jgi:Protein of unknown function (DUF3995)
VRYAAALLGLASAAVSAYWLAGGTAGLETVGGGIERLGRERSGAALAALSVVVLVKLAVAALALRLRGRLRVAGLVAGVGLAVYGALLVATGALALAGAFGTPDDEHALRWHVFFWDPWFLLWGLALAFAARSAD